jgi:flagellar biosynthetic protein FliR
MPHEWTSLLPDFLVVLSRLGPLCALTTWGEFQVLTWRVRTLTSLLLALVVLPSSGVEVPTNYSSTMVASIMGREALLGVALAIALSAVGVSVQMSGQLLGMLSGGTWGAAFGGESESQAPLSRFLILTTVATFFCTGGHRIVTVAVLDTYRWMPPGNGWTAQSATDLVVMVLTQSVLFALRAAAPMILALVVGAAIVGVATRLAPGFGQLSLNLGLNVLLLVASMALGLGVMSRVYQRELEVVTERLGTPTALESLPLETAIDARGALDAQGTGVADGEDHSSNFGEP